MKEAMLYEKLPRGLVRCHVCQWRCYIRPEQRGLCQTRQNKDGILLLLNYAQTTSIAVDPVEKKPLYHFYPGSLVFSLGSWGCNFHCRHCQNWGISCETPWSADLGVREIAPLEAVDMAEKRGCRGIAWTYNEPGIWLEYTLDCARLAKARGLYTVYVTNGFSTPEALDAIGPYLDCFRVDVKGFSDTLYRKLARVSQWRGILEVAERAVKKWGMHIEVVTNVIPTMNDDEDQLTGIARWIRDSLGETVPWHITRFFPQFQMAHLPPTPVESLEKAADLGRREGLRFVYLGNVPGHAAENTDCYACGQSLVQRSGYRARVTGLHGGQCRQCGADANFRTETHGGKKEPGR